MKSKIINIFWGIVFILVSGLLLADTVGYVSLESIPNASKAIAFGAAGAMFFATYFLSGVRKWGWLFPALVCAVLGWHSLHFRNALDLLRFDWPMWAALAIPFYVGFAMDRRHWVLLLPAYVLSVIAFLQFSDAMFMASHRAANADRTFLLTLLAAANPLLLFAIPFYAVYLWSKKNWWALLPAGGLSSIVVGVVLSILARGKAALAGVPLAVILLGFAVTLGILWLRRASAQTGWAKVPAIGFLVLAITAFLLGRDSADITQDFGFIIFLAGSVIFFLAYFLHGIRKWGWLFPALGCGGMALTIWMNNKDAGNPFTAIPLFAGMALPFFAGFAVNRKRGLLIPGLFLAAFTVFLAISDMEQGEWSGVIFFGLLALSFFVAYFLLKRPWWVLLPAGSCASLGMTVLMEILVPHQEFPTPPNTLSLGVYTWVLFLGLASTFGAVWLLHKSGATDWAKYPAGSLLVIGLLALLLGERFQETWLPVMAFVVGVTFLLAVLTRKKQKAGQSIPTIQG